jgi:phage terminase small subunit
MPRGGARPGAGRPKGSRNGTSTKAVKAQAAAAVAPKPGPKKRATVTAAPAAPVSPLEYMLTVMRDPAVDPTRRDRMAQAAAPFVHAKMEAAKPPSKAEEVEQASQIAGRGTGWEGLLQ